jgi:hypothetical protein
MRFQEIGLMILNTIIKIAQKALLLGKEDPKYNCTKTQVLALIVLKKQI